jgi:hypothetical protein
MRFEFQTSKTRETGPKQNKVSLLAYKSSPLTSLRHKLNFLDSSFQMISRFKPRVPSKKGTASTSSSGGGQKGDGDDGKKGGTPPKGHYLVSSHILI